MSEVSSEIPPKVSSKLNPGEVLRQWRKKRNAEKVLLNPQGAQPGEFARAFTQSDRKHPEPQPDNLSDIQEARRQRILARIASQKNGEATPEESSLPETVAQQQASRLARIREAVKRFVKKTA